MMRTNNRQVPKLVAAACKCRNTGEIAVGLEHNCSIMFANKLAIRTSRKGVDWFNSTNGYMGNNGTFYSAVEANSLNLVYARPKYFSVLSPMNKKSKIAKGKRK